MKFQFIGAFLINDIVGYNISRSKPNNAFASYFPLWKQFPDAQYLSFGEEEPDDSSILIAVNLDPASWEKLQNEMGKFKKTILIQFEGKAGWSLAYEKAPLFDRFINFDRSYQHLPGFRHMVIPYDPGIPSSHRDKRGWEAVKHQWSLSRKRFIDTYLLQWLPRKKKAVVIAAINNNYSASLRLKVAEQWSDFIDIFGGGWPKTLTNYRGFTASKIDLLKRYQYSLVLENQRQPGYITEKILDCLVGGAVPLYWGAPDIHEYPGLDWVPLFDENTTRIDQVIYDQQTYRKLKQQLAKNYPAIMNAFSPDNFHNIVTKTIQD